MHNQYIIYIPSIKINKLHTNSNFKVVDQGVKYKTSEHSF